MLYWRNAAQPADGAAPLQASRHAGHHRQRPCDKRSLPRSSRSGTAKRRHESAACPCCLSRVGGVPSPPNLRPSSRAGAAPCKGLPAGARISAPLTRAGSAWQAQAGSSGGGDAARDGQRPGGTRRGGGAPRAAQTGSTRRAPDLPAASALWLRSASVRSRTDAAASGDTKRRTATDRSSPPTSFAGRRG